MTSTIPPIGNPVLTGISDKTPADAPSMLGTLISGLVGILLTAATIWSFIQLLLGGLAWISSGGDKTALEEARSKIINAIIGLGIVFAAWAIFLLILQFLGVSQGGVGGAINLILPKLF